VPDEGSTFGLESAIKQVGLCSEGQKSSRTDKDMLLSTRGAGWTDLEEGITEAGSMAWFTAAGTAYRSEYKCDDYILEYSSMLGFNRIGGGLWCGVC